MTAGFQVKITRKRICVFKFSQRFLLLPCNLGEFVLCAYGFVPDIAFFRCCTSLPVCRCLLLRFRIHQTLRLKSIEALDYFSSFLLPQKRRDAPWRSSERAQFFSLSLCFFTWPSFLEMWAIGLLQSQVDTFQAWLVWEKEREGAVQNILHQESLALYWHSNRLQ